MKILVAGKQGQLARALAAAAPMFPACNLVFRGRSDWNCADANAVRAKIRELSPDVVVNAAAYTGVDAAESEPQEAFRVNADFASSLALAAADVEAAVIQVSTDYVYPGDSGRPHTEEDPSGPLNVYGQSKLAGEGAVLNAAPRSVIARTAWLFSPWGTNFVKTMLRLAAERSEIRVVGDQFGSPTYATDLAIAILKLAIAVDRAPTESAIWGVYNIVNSGVASWHEFATEIFAAASSLGVRPPRLIKIESRDYPTRARRPLYSALDNGKFCRAFATSMRPWQETVRECLQQLVLPTARHPVGDAPG